MMADGEGRLGFETSSSADARFLCRSIDFLVSAVVQHSNVGETKPLGVEPCCRKSLSARGYDRPRRNTFGAKNRTSASSHGGDAE